MNVIAMVAIVMVAIVMIAIVMIAIVPVVTGSIGCNVEKWFLL